MILSVGQVIFLAIALVLNTHEDSKRRKSLREQKRQAEQEALTGSFKFSPSIEKPLSSLYGACYVPAKNVFVESQKTGFNFPDSVAFPHPFYYFIGDEREFGSCGTNTRLTAPLNQLYIPADSILPRVGDKFIVRGTSNTIATITSISDTFEHRFYGFDSSPSGCMSYVERWRTITFNRNRSTNNPPVSQQADRWRQRLADAKIYGSLFQNIRRTPDANRLVYLFGQWTYCSGDGEIIGIDVNDTDFSNSKVIRDVAFLENIPYRFFEGDRRWYNNSSDLLSFVSSDRDGFAEGTDVSHITGMLFLDLENNESFFAGGQLPEINILSKGRRIQNLDTAVVNSDGEFTTLPDISVNNNAINVLYDVLLDSGVKEADIDLDSFVTASKMVEQQTKYVVDIPPSERNRYLNQPQEKLRIYDYNGEVPTSLDLRGKINLITDVCNGLIFYRGYEGRKVKVSVPFIELARSDTLTLTEINDDVILNKVVVNGGSDIYTDVTAEFFDIRKDMTNNSTRWGLTTTNRERRERHIKLKGVVFEEHARYLARSAVLNSMKRIYKFELPFTALDEGLEPGDVVVINSDRSSLTNKMVRIQSITFDTKLNATLIAEDYIKSQYTRWWE